MNTKVTANERNSSHVYALGEVAENTPDSHGIKVLTHIIDNFTSSFSCDSVWSRQKNKEFIESINSELIKNGFPGVEVLYHQILKEIEESRSDQDKQVPYSLYQAYHIVDSLLKLYQRPYEFVIRKREKEKKGEDEKGKRDDDLREKSENADTLEIFSIHPKKRVQEIVSNFYSSIFTSATLSPVDKVSMLLGFDSFLCQKMSSPFPDKNYGCFVVAGAHSGSKEFTQEKGYHFDLHEKEIILSIVDDILEGTNRNTGIFLSSKETLQELYWSIWELCKHRGRLILLGNDYNISGDPKDDYEPLVDIYLSIGRKLLKNREYRNEEDKMAIYKEYGRLLGKGDYEKGAILVDLIGGKFAEGVNYEESEMEIGILIGLPFKNYEENKEVYDAKSEFFYALEGDRGLAANLSYRYDAFRKVAQTAGRIHRSKEDKGVLLFIDERLLGIKKSINKNKEWDYDFLSSKNVDEEWNVLQQQLKWKKTAVFPDKNVLYEKKDLFSRLGIFKSTTKYNKFMKSEKTLKKYVENREKEKKKEKNVRLPIDSTTMVHKLEDFFERGVVL